MVAATIDDVDVYRLRIADPDALTQYLVDNKTLFVEDVDRVFDLLNEIQDPFLDYVDEEMIEEYLENGSEHGVAIAQHKQAIVGVSLFRLDEKGCFIVTHNYISTRDIRLRTTIFQKMISELQFRIWPRQMIVGIHAADSELAAALRGCDFGIEIALELRMPYKATWLIWTDPIHSGSFHPLNRLDTSQLWIT